MSDNAIYFLPGRGEDFRGGLGALITKMGYSTQGRELIGDFARLRFSEQLALIRSDLEPTFWHPGAVLVGGSYGAYLLLHTLADMRPFPGRILLSSPVLGAAVANSGFYGSLPPRADKLIQLAASGGFPPPRDMEIHTGAEDNGCDPSLAARFASLVMNTSIKVVPGAGHQLGEDYLQGMCWGFLAQS